jgi:hypothetical protein
MTTLEHGFSLRGWVRNPVSVLSFVLIWGGFLVALATGRHGWLYLFGAGIFGPSLLRELGVMRWEDEFQRDTTVRAAFHAFLATGLLLVSVMAVNGFTGTYSETAKEFEDALPASTAFFLLVLTWYFSRLLQYWGARKAALRIWGGMAIVWALLIASVMLGEHRDALDLSASRVLGQLVPVAALLLLALASLRWPRAAGAAGLAYLLWFLVQTGMLSTMHDDLPWEITLDIAILALAPIGAPAVALLFGDKP